MESLVIVISLLIAAAVFIAACAFRYVYRLGQVAEVFEAQSDWDR